MKLNIFLILTFFLVSPSLVHSAPHEHPPAPKDHDNDKPSSDKLSPLDLKPTLPPRARAQQMEQIFVYPYTQSISLRTSFLYDVKDSENASNYTLGGTYMFPRNKSPHHEIGADLNSQSSGFLHWGLKHFSNDRSFTRYYYKYGISHHFIPKDGIASLVNYKNYLILLNIGLERVMLLPSSLRLELEVTAGVNYIFIATYLGTSWGW